MELNELIQSYLDGTISAADFGELQRRIVADPVAADAFARASRMDAALAEHLTESRQTADSSAIAMRAVDVYSHGDDYIPTPPARSRWLIGAIAIAAAVVIAAGIGVWIALTERDSTPTPQQLADTHQLIAGRVLVDGAEGNPIKDGSRIDVLDEPATLALADGSRAELAPASVAIIRGSVGEVRQVIDLRSGGGKFQVAKGERRFRVDTPIGAVTVLGTEFELQLQPREQLFWNGDDDMHLRKLLILSVIVLGGSVQVDVGNEQVMLTAGANRVFADEPRREQEKPVATGRFVGYSAEKAVLTVSGREGRETVSFAVAKDAKVMINGAAGKLADLNEKHMLHLTLNGDRTTALEIRADEGAADRRREQSDLRALVAVDAEKKTVTLKAERENLTYPVSPDAKIFVNGREAKLSDIRAPETAMVQFSDDKKTVVALRQGDRRVERDGERGDFRGQIEKYDEKAGTLLVVHRADGGDRRATFIVTKETKVLMDGAKDLKLADIPEKTFVWVTANADGTTAVAVFVELRPVRRIVFDVDAEKNTVTFRVERDHITLPVSKEAKITINNRPAKLGDLKQGNVCFATMSLDGKTVLAINHRAPEGGRDGQPAKEGERKKDGDRPPVKEGERRKDGDRPALRDGEPKKDAPREGEKKDGEQRTGNIVGELKARTDTKDGKNSMIDVLAPGEEKARTYFVNWDPAIKGPIPDVLKAVRAAKVGDRVEFEWVGTNHGPAITKFKVLPKRGE